MVRKTKEDTEHTYALLLDAAEAVFTRKGVAASTLNDIAVEAGMTRGAIYWHFKDKGELVRAMCERATLPMEAMVNEVMTMAGDDPLGSVRRLTVHALTQIADSTRQHTVFDILFHKCEKTGELAEVFERELESRNECHSQIEGLFKQAVKRGQLPADTDTHLAMQALHSYLIGLMHEWLLTPEAYDLAKHAEPLVDVLLAGLRVAPPRKRSRPVTKTPARALREKIAA
jgi:TetR/AcrR family transcriptional regulator, acrAB operon repressor